MEYRNKITEYITNEGNVRSEVLPDTALFSSGLIDSFFMIEFILYLETEFSVSIDPVDVTLDNLDSVEKVESYLKNKV